jgi:hypothetical protein
MPRAGAAHSEGGSSMKGCIRVWIVGAVCLASIFGCGNSSGLYPVTGKVLCRGEPAVGATVSFVPKQPADGSKPEVLSGVVKEDGTFSLAGSRGEGAAVGDYVVLVEWKEGAGKVKGRSPGLNAPDRLKGRYLNAGRPLLTATIQAKVNELPPFEIE